MDFKAIESKWQQKWSEQKIFQPKIKDQKKFFFTTPYPYISGSLHIGHGRAITESDIFVRYKRMKGFNVLFPLAFHITGTPVLGIASAIEKGDQKKIELYKNYVRNYIQGQKEVEKIVQSFKDPWNIVNFFIPKMMDEYSALGLSIDWTRRFTTGDSDYQKFITWQFHQYKNKGYLVRGNYPVLYCPVDQNAVGEDDIQDADINPVEKQEFTLLKFKLNNNEFLVAATLRPETVYGQTNLWVRPDLEYVKVEVGSEIWLMSPQCHEKLNFQKKNPQIIGKVLGHDLIGQSALAPVIEKEIPILPSDFVEPDVGTGIVTSVPSDAPYDYIALQDLKNNPEKIKQFDLKSKEIEKIKVIPIIKTEKYGRRAGVKVVEDMKIKDQNDSRLKQATQLVYKEGFHNGTMLDNCGPYAGMKVSVAKEKVKHDLLKKNKADLFYETSREAYCRCGGKIIVAVLDNQWFLDFNAKDWKKKARQCLKDMSFRPQSARQLFQDTFEWLDKRPAARRRGLGTPLPFDPDWIIESLSDSTIYMAFYTIKNLINQHQLKPEQLTLEFFDYVFLNQGDPKKISQKNKIPEPALKEFRKNFDYWYPNDHRHTFMAHLSNHLSFFIFAHAGIFPEKYWPKKISLHGFVISEGIKMSKSKGNVIPLLEVTNNYGADAFRTYIASATNLEGTFDWRTEEINQIKKHLFNIYNLALELITKNKPGPLSSRAQAIISRFERYVQESGTALEKMELRDYSHIVIYHIPNLIHQLRKRLSKENLNSVYALILEPWIKMLSPLVPHLAEELWSKLNKNDFLSLEAWPKADQSKINLQAEAAEETIHNTLADISQVLKLTKKQHPEKITLFLAAAWKFDFIAELRKHLQETRNVGEIIKKVLTPELKPHAKDIAALVPKFVKDPAKFPEYDLGQASELSALEESKSLIKEEFKSEIEIIKEEDSQEPKAKQALPGKPAILIK